MTFTMFTDLHLIILSATAVIIAVFFIIQGQRWSELELFGRILVPFFFIFIALVIMPFDTPVNARHTLAGVIIALTVVIMVVDFVFTFWSSIRASFMRVKNAFPYEHIGTDAVPLYIPEICRAMEMLTQQGLGGLVILERRDTLETYVKGGVQFDAEIKAEVLNVLFEKTSSVHDGAVLIKRGRIAGARAILPVSDSKELPAHSGLRHRSAVGITEKTDAIALVASEQRKEISIAYRGIIVRPRSKRELIRLINRALKRKDITTSVKRKKTGGRRGK